MREIRKKRFTQIYKAPSAEYGRTRPDLARARPFLSPYFLYVIKKLLCAPAIL